jgi:N-acetylmuramoyl-L-alanine amidase
MLILHHTAGSLASSYDILQGRNAHHQVGVHYLVTDEPQPRVIRMVPEDREAFHAGHSGWRNLESLNQYSIGIEIVNLDGNIHPYPAAQRELVLKLCEDILKRNPGIRPTEVLAHSDIAVGRKVDPGSFFPWGSFALHQVGVWPLSADVQTFLRSNATATPVEMRQLLEQYGYHLEPTEAGLKMGIEAFQRHFRPTKVDGIADAETIATLRALLKRYPPSPVPTAVKATVKAKV